MAKNTYEVNSTSNSLHSTINNFTNTNVNNQNNKYDEVDKNNKYVINATKIIRSQKKIQITN